MDGFAALLGIVARIRNGVARIELAVGRSFPWPADGLRHGEGVLIGWNYNRNKPATVTRREEFESRYEGPIHFPGPDPPSSPPEADDWVMP
jgi:hypothetical protein